jgi:hypothetical protein
MPARSSCLTIRGFSLFGRVRDVTQEHLAATSRSQNDVTIAATVTGHSSISTDAFQNLKSVRKVLGRAVRYGCTCCNGMPSKDGNVRIV